MAAAFQPVTMSQIRGHLLAYGFQAGGILLVLIHGWANYKRLAQIFPLLLGVIVIALGIGALVNKLSPIQQAMIAKEAMLITAPPIFNALLLIGIMVVYAFFPLVGISLWVAVLVFEGLGFMQATRDWDGYLAKVNANAY
jgi:hypothetical protein